ncbi:MAG TPA: HAD-IIIA family hydrolase [Rubrivivax sp.]|nr:HAD-IIIA family hydrolase [Rubrivivax sp.]
MNRPALFVDKDGTLIDDVPYNVEPSLLRLRPAAAQALRALQDAGFALVMVTNQSGIGRGLFNADQLQTLLRELRALLRQEAGVEFTDVMHCPHEPGSHGLPQCLCRKPRPGMLIEAGRRHRLDLTASWMIGDTLDDVEAGHRAGCRSLLYDSGGENVWRRSALRWPEKQVTDWDAALRHILAESQALRA